MTYRCRAPPWKAATGNTALFGNILHSSSTYKVLDFAGQES